MKKFILCFLLIVGCTSTTSLPQGQPTPKYSVGDCLMLVDPSNGSKPTYHRLRIEKVDLAAQRYWYRWRLDNNKWDSDLSTIVGKFEVLEKISKKVFDCPKV